MASVGLQVYSLRERAAKDFPGTLKAIADIGYAGVEMAGFYGCEPAEIAKLLKDLGLQAFSAHTDMPNKGNLAELLDTYSLTDTKILVSGYGPDHFKTVDDCKKAAAVFEEAAQLLAPHGIRFGFHNHWFEFAVRDARYVYDILMAEAPTPFSELDTYWCAYAKADPVAVIKKYNCRQPLLHIKDGPLPEQMPHTAVGSGKMDIPAVVGAADSKVLEWLVVELDECATDMLEAVAQSYKYLSSTGLGTGRK
jgi:sugar phosphate isomerase/epimerase